MNSKKLITGLMKLAGIVAWLFISGCAATTPAGSSTKGTGIAAKVLDWSVPTMREDGTALPVKQIAGYKIYYGSNSGNYTGSLDINGAKDANGQLVSDYTLNSLPHGTYYFTMTTIDTDGRESLYSNEIKVTI